MRASDSQAKSESIGVSLAELDGSFRDDSGLEHLSAEGVASTLLFHLKGGDLVTRTGHNVRSLSRDAEDRGTQ